MFYYNKFNLWDRYPKRDYYKKRDYDSLRQLINNQQNIVNFGYMKDVNQSIVNNVIDGYFR